MSLDLKLADASIDPRPIRECLRCSYIWRQAEIQGKPRWCPRCGSAVWDEEPRRRNSRRPGDPPNPNWKQRKREAFIRNGRTIQPDSRPGIPRNYILEPYVSKASVSGGLPPPPSRTTMGMPPPPRSHNADNRVDSSGTGSDNSVAIDSTQIPNGARRGDGSSVVSGVVSGPSQGKAEVVSLAFPVPDVEYAIAAAQGESE